MKFEIKKLRNLNYASTDIIQIFNFSGDQRHKDIGKNIQLSVRSMIRDLYDADEHEIRYDKLRDETRLVMRDLAIKIYGEMQQSSQLFIKANSHPDSGDR